MTELTLPQTVERRNKLDIALGYCTEIHPGQLVSLGEGLEIRVDEPRQLVDFLRHDAEDDRLYFVRHLQAGGREWEYVCFARRRQWTLFCSIFSTSLAYNPQFADGRRRRLCSGGTRILGRDALERAYHESFAELDAQLEAALVMDLNLSEAMTGKNLSNGFNIGGSKSLVFLDQKNGRPLIKPDEVREFARFMARAHNSISQSIPVFVGTGSDLNFHEHGDAYYEYCSRIAPNYVGNEASARRWGRATTGNTTEPTAAGVLACLDAVVERLEVPADQQGILVKGLGGIGRTVAASYLEKGWRVYATEMRDGLSERIRDEFGDKLVLVDEEQWSTLKHVSIFSPNASSASVTRENLPVLRDIGVRAVVGGENNIRDKDVEADAVYRDYGILTFADFLLNGGGAWIVDAEMVERPVQNVTDWFRTYQVPTVLKTIDLAKEQGRAPESIFVDFIEHKVRELLT